MAWSGGSQPGQQQQQADTPRLGMVAMNGKLAIVWPVAHVYNVRTGGQEGRPVEYKDGVWCDVILISGPGQAEVWRGQMMHSGQIIGSVKNNCGGDPVLGTVTGYNVSKGPTSCKWDTEVSKNPAACALADGWLASVGGTWTPTPLSECRMAYSLDKNTEPTVHGQSGGGYGGWPEGAVPAQQWQQAAPTQAAPQQSWQQPAAPAPQQPSWQQPAPAQQGYGAPAAQSWQQPAQAASQAPQAPAWQQPAAPPQQSWQQPAQQAMGQPAQQWQQAPPVPSAPPAQQQSTLDAMLASGALQPPPAVAPAGGVGYTPEGQGPIPF